MALPAAAVQLQDDFKREMDQNVKMGVLKISKDGKWYAPTPSQIAKIIWWNSIPGVLISKRLLLKDARQFLNKAGFSAAYAPVNLAAFTVPEERPSIPDRSIGQGAPYRAEA